MKRASALIIALLLCLMLPISVFAEEIFIVEDGEDEFIPDVQTTTTEPAEKTTVASDNGLNIDTDSIGSYIDGIADKLGSGVNSILGGLEDFDFNFGNSDNTESTTSSGLSGIQVGDYAQANQSSSMTTYPNQANNQQAEQTQETTTQTEVVEEELPSVLVVNNAEDGSWALSGSTLTLIVFIAAIVILVLVVVIVLVVMTRKTEFNSAVKNKSTLPSVDRPDTLAQFIEDDIPDDGNNYSDIAYWNK